MNQKSITNATVTMNWCTAPAKAEALTQLFVTHADTKYISHSELQGARAASTTRWSNDLASTLHAEISATLAQDPANADNAIAIAEANDALAGMALLSFNCNAAIPYASLDDLVVHAAYRDAGIGQQLLTWVEQQVLSRGIHRLFLESGKDNHAAHRFFDRQGYQAVSVVMLKELGHA